MLLLRRILIKTLVAIATLLAVSALVFFGTEALPGDAASAALGQEATPELLATYREQFGLDRPVLERYSKWLFGFVRGDLGSSVPSGDPIWSLLEKPLRNTAAIALATLLILVPLGIVLGVFSAVRRDGVVDHAVGLTTVTFLATPEFVIGILAVTVFAVWLGLLPPVSLIDSSKPLTSQMSSLALPVLTLVAGAVAQSTRMVRASMIDTLRENYVEVARLKGVSERRILFRHALPNALGPTIQILAITVGWLIGGVVVVEVVFQYPGVGTAMTSAVGRGDLAMVEAIAMLLTVVYVVTNLVADVAVTLLNPRLRRPNS